MTGVLVVWTQMREMDTSVPALTALSIDRLMWSGSLCLFPFNLLLSGEQAGKTLCG